MKPELEAQLLHQAVDMGGRGPAFEGHNELVRAAADDRVMDGAEQLSAYPLALVLGRDHHSLDDAQNPSSTRLVQVPGNVRHPVLQEVPKTALGQQPAADEA